MKKALRRCQYSPKIGGLLRRKLQLHLLSVRRNERQNSQFLVIATRVKRATAENMLNAEARRPAILWRKD